MKRLAEYINGSYKVTIYDDGTKIREKLDDNDIVKFPEAIDIKITNYCDGRCPFCHENSTTKGKHSDINELKNSLDGLPPGIELAIGGGNPFEYPNLEEFLIWAKDKGYICNITINSQHIFRFKDTIKKFVTDKLIYGIGVSLTDYPYFRDIVDLMKISDNVVIHVIIGVTPLEFIFTLSLQVNNPIKIVFLGYKEKGRGITYYNENIVNLSEYVNKLKAFFNSPIYTVNIGTVSFDTLAIEQLNLNMKDSILYMGDDGKFSMYYDAINKRASISSTNEKSYYYNKIIDFWENKNSIYV